ncbi:MAG: cytochrome oxidase subunit III [Bacteroidia bacterium]|jgi:cytochrome c oxidase subunit 3|nr:cytochrome oxidase subunit III [Bacteroidia bacterium]
MIKVAMKPSDEIEQPGIHPSKFVTWLLIVASVMLFASLTSAYIVRKGEGNWLLFDIPNVFAFSVVIAIIGSITMQLAYMMAKKDEIGKLKIFSLLTLIAGFGFVISQYLGWVALVNNNIHFVGNPSESFFYVISGVHLAHVIGGIIFVGVVTNNVFRYKVHKKNLLSINLCTTYWHFLGFTWIYLYFFLLLNR